MPISSTRRRLYWACQLLGWALFHALFVVVGVASGGLPSIGPGRLAAFVASGLALNIAATHVLHRLSSRWAWPDRPLAALLLRVIPTVIALGAAVSVLSNLVVAGSDLLFGPLAPTAPPPVRVDVVTVSGAAFNAIVFGAWAVVYYLAVYAFRFRDAERDRLVLRASLAEARLQALDQQLNPHFLFNALNSIRALVLDEPHEARRAVTLLSSLLRQTLKAGREATHTLEAELALVRPYLDLEAIRFGDRLRVSWDVAPEASGAEVPALLLLTLVENAAKHGVARCEAGGEIAVRAHASGDVLTLDVTNPAAPRASAPEVAGGTGTGLANARERLALLYGSAADLSLSHDADRVTARARLPFRSDA
ncbi:sensor histidine kinase [Rubricoccus marinus]|uniref:Signal transduction histidine kinase internal region domain-containing protein n=1 Tax=Rubricoccus marinus TaxID=716817 RepID=A0A259TWM3_9BACT|nr:histidine kinase [Rubricoccus marinus]OZC01948.1 hypothetical protein BSZ36_02475 [Rubricoccus marinus]